MAADIVRWVSFDLKTRRRGFDLQTRTPGKAGRLLGAPTTTTIAALIWDEDKGEPVPDWKIATEPGQTGLLALDPISDAIYWGGYIARRQTPKLTEPWVDVLVSTFEGYFDRRYTQDHAWTDADQATIFAGLVADATANGIPMTVDALATGILRTRSYTRDEDKRILGNLTELMGVQNGIEFTVDVRWADAAHTTVEIVPSAAVRIGTASATPPIQFTMPGNIVEGSFDEDYSEEHGANAVTAVSSGEGDTRPESALHLAQLANWVRWERQVTPSTSITDIATLDAHATAELAQTWNGLQELKLEAHLALAPHPSTWSIGDDVGVSLTCPRFPGYVDASGQLQPGLETVERCVGWDIDFATQRFTPRVLMLKEAPA